MKKFAVPFLLLLLLSVCQRPSAAGELTPGLEKMLQSHQPGDFVKVMLALYDDADIPALDAQLHAQHTPLAERHEIVVRTLQEAAAKAQAPLLEELSQLKQKGLVKGWTAHWIADVIIVKATVSTVRQLADRPEVQQAEPDLVVSPILPVRQTPAGRDREIGVAPGLEAIQADRVWYELGITGEGALVANMDTGVDYTHPALNSRWEGNFAPHSQAWLDLLGTSNTPSDGHGHGTHTMGTICGVAPNDTIGVAWGAHWIATNPINQGTGTEFDNDVIAGFEWFADPDGDPGTLDDVPDVVQNSWGVNENFSGYYDCDSRWWDAIDDCEAAGVVVTWSAGNEGPGSTTLRSPADRADTPYNCFSVGATQHYAPYTIASFSSRGPSGCGGPYATKPEVSAPGVDIYSSYPGGGYQYMDGTSMAGPHVAGVVGLMRSANPNLDVTTVKQVLMETATDLGSAGEDNTYGWGLVNAYEAVLAVMEGVTYESHQLLSDTNGNGVPNPGETVTLEVDLRALTDDPVTSVHGILTSGSPEVTITTGESDYPDFNSAGQVEGNITPFVFTVDPEAEPIGTLDFTLQVTSSSQPRDFSFTMDLGSLTDYYLYDVEEGAGEWTHTSADGWGDNWHVSTEDASSPTQSWKCGDTGTGQYETHLDARLISPPLTILPYTQLFFQHRINSETSGAYPDSAYDGGVVEISTDDGINWSQLLNSVSGGYNKHFRGSSGGGNPATHPFPGGTPCYAGTIDWSTAVFDLADYDGQTVRLRFRFGSDQGGNDEGWYVDDITLRGYVEPSSEVLELTITNDGAQVTLTWNPVPGAVNYRVYYSDEAYSGFTLLQQTSASSLVLDATGLEKRFYRVTWE